MTDIPPLPPGVVPDRDRAPLTSTDTLKVGDVVQIAQEVRKHGEDPFWWKRFAVVESVIAGGLFRAVFLAMRPNLDTNDFRSDVKLINLRDPGYRRIITKLHNPWPQGVSAIVMKYIALGIIKLGED